MVLSWKKVLFRQTDRKGVRSKMNHIRTITWTFIALLVLFVSRSSYGQKDDTALRLPPQPNLQTGPQKVIANQYSVVGQTQRTERERMEDEPTYLHWLQETGQQHVKKAEEQFGDPKNRPVRRVSPASQVATGRADLTRRLHHQSSSRQASADETEDLHSLEVLPSPAQTELRIPLAGQPDPEAVHKLAIRSDGQLLSLVIRDAAVKDVLALIAQTQNVNIVCSQHPGSDGSADSRVTLSLEAVRLEDALDAILVIAGYTWSEKNGIIYVTSLTRAGVVPADIQGRETKVFTLSFVSAVDVDQAVKGMLSPVGKSFMTQSSSQDNRRTEEIIVVEDLSSYLWSIGQYISQVDQPPQQVMIQAHILEVELDDNLRHGINFEQIFRTGGHALSMQQSGFANSNAAQALFFNVTGDDINALVEILQTTTDAKTLASPRVLCLNGQESKIQIGEKLGYRVLTNTQTSTLEDVQFLDVGVVLRVTPRITHDGFVLMRVKPEVSNGQVNPETGLPDEETTEVETDVLLRDGHGMVIGGLIKESVSNTQSKIPILGELRHVGALFQRREVKESRSEIIIVLVPHIVPYDSDYSQRDEEEVQRASTPMLYGSLQRVARPEPQLPDTFDHPRTIPQQLRTKCRCRKCRLHANHLARKGGPGGLVFRNRTSHPDLPSRTIRSVENDVHREVFMESDLPRTHVKPFFARRRGSTQSSYRR